MGVIEKTYYDNLPNATTCNTIGDVFKTHADKNQELIMELKFIYGMLVIFGIGVVVAMITFLTEAIWSIGGMSLKTVSTCACLCTCAYGKIRGIFDFVTIY